MVGLGVQLVPEEDRQVVFDDASQQDFARQWVRSVATLMQELLPFDAAGWQPRLSRVGAGTLSFPGVVPPAQVEDRALQQLNHGQHCQHQQSH